MPEKKAIVPVEKISEGRLQACQSEHNYDNVYNRYSDELFPFFDNHCFVDRTEFLNLTLCYYWFS